MSTHTSTDDTGVGGAVVVFAKCPIPGSSKTRLAPLLGAEGAALLAQAMLSDILVSLNGCPSLGNTLKVLVYAPGTKVGEDQMISILQSLDLPYHTIDQLNCTGEESETYAVYDGWILLPMKSSTPRFDASKSELTSSSLGDKLEDALNRTRELISTTKSTTNRTKSMNEAVLFLGMDSPEITMEEIIYGLHISSGKVMDENNEENGQLLTKGKAHLCPANDGGYGLLSVPIHAPSNKIFSGVRWSHSLTAVSQLKALSDSNIDISIGKLMNDIDEPSDILELCKRLIASRSETNNGNELNDLLSSLSSGISHFVPQDATKNYPNNTWNRLVDLNVIREKDGKYFVEELEKN